MLVGRGIEALGYRLTAKRPEEALSAPTHELADIFRDQEFMEIYAQCQSFTMSGLQRMYALYKAVDYVCLSHIPGALVECGVWQGGSMMLCALTLIARKETTRRLYLYDTFEGMPLPDGRDIDPAGKPASELWSELEGEGVKKWCYAPLDAVRANLLRTGYPPENTIFVSGKVEESIPGIIPDSISLLRLDTDWYTSTCHELTHLFPVLAVGGVLILDDYGYWSGARQATDEYLREHSARLLLDRIDSGARIAVKQGLPAHC